MDFATTTCTALSASTTECLTPSPVISHDSGDVVFMLGVVVFLLALQAVGMLFSTFIHPKPR